MISSKIFKFKPYIRKLRNLEVSSCCYSEDFNREHWSNLTDFQNNLSRANFKKVFKFNKMY